MNHLNPKHDHFFGYRGGFFALDPETGDEYEPDLPTRREVCPRCHGEGVHDHPAFNGFTGEEMREMGDDFRENYISGVYDVTCTECSGRNVVNVTNLDALSPSDLAILDECARERNRDAAIERAERLAGC